LKIKLIISSIITAIIISGCATGTGNPMIDNNQKAIIGTTLGALTGIVLGNNMGGGNKNRNKVIGAVIGATIGGTVGYNLDKQAKEVASSLNTYVDNSPNKVKIDEYIYLYDGTIRAKVIQIKDEVIARIENNGTLGSRKGVNFPNTIIDINVITKKDEEDIAWGVENQVDYFAISFVQNKTDMERARKLLNGYKGKLIAKIEKFDAVENIDEILEASDGLMVARGDLGIEVPYYDVPTIQKMLIKKANIVGKPVITATQMLLSMTQNERATRAEISDVANAVLDGTDVVMLSEESAVGEDPVNVVDTMSNIIARTEDIYNYDKQSKFDYLDEFDVIQSTVTKLADDLKAKGILALTSSGKSATKISRYRPKTAIYAFTHKKKVLNSLTAVWGVEPIGIIKEGQASKMFQKMLKTLEKEELLDKTGTYVATVGYPVGMPGSTNTIKILTPAEIEYYLNLKEKKK